MVERVGPYRVEDEIGRGGMGIVYRAVDERLGRAAALKTLPSEVAQDPGRLERFEREARTLASLNHPNLAGIYGVEEDESGGRYLALELVEGETLADRLDRGTLPVEDAIELAVQVAAGVEAAHEAGVVHRDLKPANIKITPDGVAKVLDFGLAKADEGVTSGSSISQAATLTTPGKHETMEGAILGTAAYMSPEQARGRRVDKRSDIWSFGVVLYEMLCGSSPFVGETVSDSIGAILHKDVDLGRLPAGTPSGVRRVLARCVERDKGQRYRDIGDVRVELLRAMEEPEEAAPSGGGVGWVVAALVGAACLAIGGGAVWLMRPTPEAKVAKVDLLVATDQERLDEVFPQISPDGGRVAYIAGNMIHVRELDSFEAREVTGTEDAGSVFWSPDGEWIGFTMGHGVYKVRLSGGGVIKVCDTEDRMGSEATGAWTADGRIVFRGERALWEVPARGGEATELLANSEDELDFHAVRSIPGTDAVTFVTHMGNMMEHRLEVMRDSRRVVVETMAADSITSVGYSPSGHLLYSVGFAVPELWAVGFDVDRMVVTGEPFLVLEGATFPSVSDDGTLAVKRGAAMELGGAMVWVKPSTDTELATVVPAGVGDELDLVTVWGMSPNGRWVAVSAGVPTSADLWVLDLERKSMNRLTFGSVFAAGLGWSPDSAELAVMEFNPMSDTGSIQTRFLAADGSGEARDAIDGIVIGFDDGWERVLVRNDPREGKTVYWVQPMDGSGESEVVFESDRGFGTELGWESLSPEGDLLLITDDSSGTSQVFCLRLDGGRGRYQISTDGGTAATWSRDGSWVYYEDRTTNRVMRASVEWEYDENGERGSLRFGMPEDVFSAQDLGLQLNSRWAFGRDGTFLALKNETGDGQGPRARLSIVTNWFEEFRGR